MELATTILAILGTIYAIVRAVLAAVQTPVVYATGKLDEPKMKKDHPIASLLAALFAINPTAGKTTEKNVTARSKKMPMILTLCSLGFLMAGCANTTTSLNPWGVNTSNQPGNPTFLSKDGDQKAVYQGFGGTNAKVDKDGVWFMTPGTGSTLAKDGVYGYFPGDLEIEELEYDPTTGIVKIKNMKMTNSKPIDSQAPISIASFAAIENMTQAEATKQIRIWEEAGKITKTLADGLLQCFVPKLPIR